jgi:hypothetical protein
MIFEFEEDYNQLSEQCPPKSYNAQNLKEVFRWTFSDIEDERNFQTQFHKNPKRFLQKSDIEQCKALALSMFDNLEGAKSRFTELKEDFRNIYQSLGTNIAKGNISVNCGVNGNIERFGHFNHHPSKGIPAKKSFLILENENL